MFFHWNKEQPQLERNVCRNHLSDQRERGNSTINLYIRCRETLNALRVSLELPVGTLIPYIITPFDQASNPPRLYSYFGLQGISIPFKCKAFNQNLGRRCSYLERTNRFVRLRFYMVLWEKRFTFWSCLKCDAKWLGWHLFFMLEPLSTYFWHIYCRSHKTIFVGIAE